MLIIAALASGARPRRAAAGRAAALTALAATADAHNWLNAPKSRANQASTIKPCRKRIDFESPHVRVNRGQPFLIEWMGGHPGSFHWFSVLRADNEDKLAMLTEAVLHEYVNDAPPDACYMDSPLYERFHYGWTGNALGASGSLMTHLL